MWFDKNLAETKGKTASPTKQLLSSTILIKKIKNYIRRFFKPNYKIAKVQTQPCKSMGYYFGLN